MVGASNAPIRKTLRLGEDIEKAQLRRRIAGPLLIAYGRDAPDAGVGEAEEEEEEMDDTELPAGQEFERVMRELLTVRHPRSKRTAKSKGKLVGCVCIKRSGALWGNTTISRQELAKKVTATIPPTISPTPSSLPPLLILRAPSNVVARSASLY